MHCKPALPCLAAGLLVAACFPSLCSAGPPPAPAARSKTTPPAALQLRCFDFAVTDISFKLQTTQLGDPGVEHPTDRLQVAAVIRNVGAAPLTPSIAMPSIYLYRNGELVVGSVLPESLRPAGSTYTFSRVDTIFHGAPVTYKVSILNLAGECRTDNNDMTLAVDESKLHAAAGGAAPVIDLAVSMFSCDKRWEQKDGQLKATFYLSAKVSNNSNAYASAPSNLTFFSDSWTSAVGMPVPISQLPGPHESRVLTVTPPATSLQQVKANVRARIKEMPGEVNTANNVSSNACAIDNSAATPEGEILIMDFPPLRMIGNQLLAYPKVVNRQQAPLNLRLILSKDGVVKRQWKPLTLPPRGTVEEQYSEGIPNPPVIFGLYRYRLVLTSDLDSAQPAAGSILAQRERNLSWIQMGQGALQDTLADPNTGLPKQLYDKDHSLRIHQVTTSVSTLGISVEVKGKKIVEHWFDQNFTFNVVAKPRVENGEIKLDVINKNLDTSSTVQDILGNIVLPGIYGLIVVGVQNYAEKEIVKKVTEASSGIGGGQVLLGVVCLNQALLLYL
ncbi:MAG: hypothetical protein ABR961_15920 [Thermoanaerobaculaceae bacterium]